MNWREFTARMKIHRNPINWVYSADNYGRFVVLSSVFTWMTVGALLMVLSLDVFEALAYGFPKFLRLLFSVAVLVGLIEFLPDVVPSFRDIKEIHRLPSPGSPAPTPLIATILVASIFVGAITVYIFRGYVVDLAHVYGVILVYSTSAIFALSVWISIAWVFGWFVIFPDKYSS